jgi:hypothetical protein
MAQPKRESFDYCPSLLLSEAEEAEWKAALMDKPSWVEKLDFGQSRRFTAKTERLLRVCEGKEVPCPFNQAVVEQDKVGKEGNDSFNSSSKFQDNWEQRLAPPQQIRVCHRQIPFERPKQLCLFSLSHRCVADANKKE